MDVMPFLKRNMRWRFHNAFTIVVTILQPMLWLVLYSAVAGQSMKGAGISNYTAFILPGLVILVSFGSCSSGGIMNYLMKADGSFYRVLIAPVRRSSIIVGQLLEAVLCTLFEVGTMCLVSLFFSVRLSMGFAGLLSMLLLVSMTAFSMAGLAYAVSLSLPDEIAYETVMNAIVLPVFFLSTALFPADSLAGGLAVAVNLNPFTHVINALRSLILTGGIEPFELLRVVLVLAAMCIASFSWAYLRLQKETAR